MSVKYVAEIVNVKEILLAGTADLEFWRGRLRREELFAFDADGRAEVFIGTIEAKFNGILFREQVFSVAVSRQADGERHDGFFLVQAFNSSRLFAFVERLMFQTPYVYAQIELNFPASVKLQSGGENLFEAKWAADFAAENAAEEWWEGAIFLPKKENAAPQVFYARIGGETKTAPFNQTQDFLEISRTHPHYRLLTDSDFQPREWKTRDNAAHARSKTVKK